jgi:hypothetical protein
MGVIHDSNGNGIGQTNPLAVRQVASDVIVPVDIQARLASTIQTHNAVSVAASGNSTSSWIDTDGFLEIAVTVLSDLAKFNITIQWSNDGNSLQGSDWDVKVSTKTNDSVSVTTKARYARLFLYNSDTATHIMSAWAYLKA